MEVTHLNLAISHLITMIILNIFLINTKCYMSYPSSQIMQYLPIAVSATFIYLHLHMLLKSCFQYISYYKKLIKDTYENINKINEISSTLEEKKDNMKEILENINEILENIKEISETANVILQIVRNKKKVLDEVSETLDKETHETHKIKVSDKVSESVDKETHETHKIKVSDKLSETLDEEIKGLDEVSESLDTMKRSLRFYGKLVDFVETSMQQSESINEVTKVTEIVDKPKEDNV